MRFSRARYVTLCQQSLVTAAVLAVGLSAAGVKTLDIVPQPGTTTGSPGASPGGSGAGASSYDSQAQGQASGEGAAEEKAEVDSAPVTPKVREVAVTAPPKQSAPDQQARKAPQQAPEKAAPEKQAPAKVVAQTAPQAVEGYATVGVTWKHGVELSDEDITIEVRTQDKGTWSGWMPVEYHDDHGPSEDEAKDRARPGTDALVIGDVDQVQMRAETADGAVPPDMRLAIIDPGTGKLTKAAPAIDTSKLSGKGGDPQASGVQQVEGDGVSDTIELSAMKRSPKPTIYSRAQWGANEKMREQTAPGYGTVQTGFVHHTVNANNYTAAQVPALLRGIYAYHTQSRGWRDIGYNYLVDRFGRIWEGRYGGVERAVVGAHTSGYNEVSFALSAIGNFDIASPPQAVLDAYARLFAWKLSIYNIPANATGLRVKSRTLNAINGHRDVGSTACPGRYLYAKLPAIRTAARKIQLGSGTTPTTPPTPPKPPEPAFTSPTQAPRAAVAQPSTIAMPRALNIAGSAYGDLVLKRSTGAIRVLPTGGQTNYTTAVATPGSWKSLTLLAAVGDVTGDGKGDVLGRSAGRTRVYRGDGAGHVSKVGTNATKQFQLANKVIAAGDWNGDGKNDVISRRANGGLYLSLGKGNGTFRNPRALSSGWGAWSSITVPGDVTGDGRPDLVGVYRGDVYRFANVGVSKLGARVKLQSIGSEYDTVLGGARDLSGDGVGDLLVRRKASGQLAILNGKRGGEFGPRLGLFTQRAANWKRLSAGQMMGSGQADLVGLNPSGKQLVVLGNNGLTNTGAVLPGNISVPGASMVINVGDWNRDGKGDVVTRQDDGDRLVLRPGQGNGQFGAGVVMSDGWKTFANIIGAGDVTGDGIPDLVARTASGPMTIFPGNGKTGFKAPVLAPASMKVFNQIGSGGWRSGSMPGSSFYGPGGGFVPFTGTTGAGWMGAAYNWVTGPGDLDGDGLADLVARDSDGVLWLLPGTSNGHGARRFLASGFAGYDFIG